MNWKTMLAAAALTGLAGSHAIHQASAAFAMDRPALSVGDEMVFTFKSGGKKSEVVKFRATASGKDTFTYMIEGQPCRPVRLHGGFLLSATFEGEECQKKNRRAYHPPSARVWPLQPGNKFTYTFDGINRNGKSYKGEFKCRVRPVTTTIVPAGTFDTIPVSCDTREVRRTYYMAPALGTWVKYTGEQIRGSSRSTAETISYRIAGAKQ